MRRVPRTTIIAASSQPPGPNEQEILKMEYEQVNTNFRMLADIRFKLLALVPALGGAAVYVLSMIVTDKQVGKPEYLVAFLISLIGFVATLGILFYDQRNTELYNELIGRASDLEKLLKLPAKGQFRQRPPRGRFLFKRFSMGHDVGLAMIYGPVLGGWLFPLAYAGHSFLQSFWHRGNPLYVALGIALVVAAIFTLELIRLDGSLPGQTKIRIGELDHFQSNTGKLRLRFQSRNMSRTFDGKLTPACLDQTRPEISQTARGRSLKARYKTGWKWNEDTEEWHPEKEITEVKVLPIKRIETDTEVTAPESVGIKDRT